MEPRQITASYTVSPQIDPEDLTAIAAAGFTMVICNRPDGEIPPSHHADVMEEAAKAAGLSFVRNPFDHSAFSMDLVTAQAEALAAATGPVFAYCASGNRCTVLWGLGAAKAGTHSPEEVVSIAADQGYNLAGLMPQLSALSPKD